MRAHLGLGGVRLAFAVLVVLASPGGRPLAPAQPAAAAARGASLFLGQTRFENGGTPCGSCHRLSSLGFPNGGTVGPDLSSAYQTLGPEGMDVTLKTLFFPTMMPLFEKRPLTAGEQDALKALLQQSPASPAGAGETAALAAIAAAGFLVLAAITWMAGRRRLHGVRAPLVVRLARKRGGLRHT